MNAAENPTREKVAAILALAPPYGTLERRVLEAALRSAKAKGLTGAYVAELESALEAS